MKSVDSRKEPPLSLRLECSKRRSLMLFVMNMALLLGALGPLAVGCKWQSNASKLRANQDDGLGALREALKPLTAVDAERIEGAFKKLLMISPSLINGSYDQMPSIHHMSILESVLNILESVRDFAHKAGNRVVVDNALQAAGSAIANDSRFLTMRYFNLKEKPYAEQSYVFKSYEFELRQHLNGMYVRLNGFLAVGEKIALQKLRAPPLAFVNTAPVVNLMQNLERVFNSVFSQTGYSTVSILEQMNNDAAKGSAPVAEKALIKILQNADFRVCMRAPVDTRFGISVLGFLNQFATGTSKGVNNSQERDIVEARLLGISHDRAALAQYQATRPEFKPKYAYLQSRAEDQTEWQIGAGVYGQDRYCFNLQKLISEKRITFMAGDSLLRVKNFTEKMLAPEGPYFVGRWDHLFTPLWTTAGRSILAAYVARNAGSDTGFFVMPSSVNGEKLIPIAHKVNKTVDYCNAAEIPSNYRITQKANEPSWPPCGTYVEAQIFGPLTVSDLSTFTYQDDTPPPSATFLEQFRNAKVKIYKRPKITNDKDLLVPLSEIK